MNALEITADCSSASVSDPTTTPFSSSSSLYMSSNQSTVPDSSIVFQEEEDYYNFLRSNICTVIPGISVCWKRLPPLRHIYLSRNSYLSSIELQKKEWMERYENSLQPQYIPWPEEYEMDDDSDSETSDDFYSD